MYENKKRITSLKKYLPSSLINYALENYSKRMLQQLKKGKLLSKILKEKYFWKSKFKTTYNTLDPRSDTETLLEVFLEKYQDFADKELYTIIDMCCGTGAIGISLLMELDNLRGEFVDISHKALQVCKYNIRQHKLWHKTKIIKKSLEEIENRKVDFLVSNPPYLLKEEIIFNPILAQDPYISLYGGEDGLYFYHLLSIYIKKNVKYFACVEIDFSRRNEILNIFVKMNFKEIFLYKDMSGKERVLYCKCV
jgi:release factor glutamine methyltransferase